jgi:phenylalanyl-tRNA synthetase alpha chain
MKSPVLDPSRLTAALSVRDLTDPSCGPHAMQSLLDDVVTALAAPGVDVRRHRALPIVTARDNYDRLYYPPDAVTRDARYTRWLSPNVLLRTQTSAMIPPLLDELGAAPDVLLVCPGLVYRRDCIDRLHVGEPHQVDLWRIARHGALDLRAMIDAVVAAALPGWRYRAVPTEHPYTVGGLQIDVARGPDWIEIGECGVASPRVLADAGLGDATGLAMGLGLDRLVMLRKGLDDIRLLRSPDPRIASQMLDLAPWRAVSSMPAATRDLSIATDATDTAEDLGDRVRAALGERADTVEAIEIRSATPYDALPPAARARLGIAPGQQNLLVRVVLRDLSRTLTADAANRLRDAIYAALHRGTVWQWAAQEPALV